MSLDQNTIFVVSSGQPPGYILVPPQGFDYGKPMVRLGFNDKNLSTDRSIPTAFSTNNG